MKQPIDAAAVWLDYWASLRNGLRTSLIVSREEPCFVYAGNRFLFLEGFILILFFQGTRKWPGKNYIRSDTNHLTF